jgi:hypothetical protein
MTGAMPALSQPAPHALRDLASAAGVFGGAGFVEGSDDPTFRDVLARDTTPSPPRCTGGRRIRRRTCGPSRSPIRQWRCTEGTPIECDDGDACTIDRCDPVTGRTSSPASRPEALSCACEQDPPAACAGELVPDFVARRTARACVLVGEALDPATRRPRPVLKRAANGLRGVANGPQGGTSERPDAGVRDALAAQLADDAQRAVEARAGS